MITTDDGLKKAKDLEILFIEVSAKSGLNIQNLFKTIASNLPGVLELSNLGQSILPTSHGATGITFIYFAFEMLIVIKFR